MKSEHLRIGIMGVMIAGLAFYWLFTPPKKAPAPPKSDSPGFSQITAVLTPSSLAPQKIEPEAKGGEKEGSEQGGGRNPFALPSGIRPLLKKEKEEGKTAKVSEKILPEPKMLNKKEVLPEMKVNSILITNSWKLAILNSRVVTIGDVVGNEKVVDIQKDRIIMESGGQKRTILLDPGSISLAVKGGRKTDER